MRRLSLLLLLLFVGHCAGLPSPSTAAASVVGYAVGVNGQQSSVTPPLSDSEQLQPIQHSDKATPLAQRARLQWARRVGLGQSNEGRSPQMPLLTELIRVKLTPFLDFAV
jgi:hypothetical protein